MLATAPIGQRKHCDPLVTPLVIVTEGTVDPPSDTSAGIIELSAFLSTGRHSAL